MAEFSYKNIDNFYLHKFMGHWYVVGGRTTRFEKGAFNSVEKYAWNEKKNRIDITFFYNKDSLDGPIKKINQKGWLTSTPGVWKVSPMWPFKFDFLVLGVAEDYSWTIIGVPDQKYVWLMTRNSHPDEAVYQNMLNKLKNLNYNTKNIKRIKHYLSNNK